MSFFSLGKEHFATCQSSLLILIHWSHLYKVYSITLCGLIDEPLGGDSDRKVSRSPVGSCGRHWFCTGAETVSCVRRLKVEMVGRAWDCLFSWLTCSPWHVLSTDLSSLLHPLPHAPHCYFHGTPLTRSQISPLCWPSFQLLTGSWVDCTGDSQK